MYRQISHGFVLIELMQVLAIVSILVVVVLPAYKNYTLRAIVSEGLEAVLPLREKIEEYYAHHGRFPKHNQEIQTLTLRPELVKADLATEMMGWTCGYAKATPGMEAHGGRSHRH
jgi:type IV pilus assembly protein PilA